MNDILQNAAFLIFLSWVVFTLSLPILLPLAFLFWEKTLLQDVLKKINKILIGLTKKWFIKIILIIVLFFSIIGNLVLFTLKPWIE